MITSQQCRAARGLLGWSQQELSARSSVSRPAIAEFELGKSTPVARTIRDLIAAFETAGIRFIEAEEGVTGPGVALKWGVELPERQQGGGSTDATEGPDSLKALSWEDDIDEAANEAVTSEILELRKYWRERPEQWAGFHESSRQVILGMMGLRRL